LQDYITQVNIALFWGVIWANFSKIIPTQAKGNVCLHGVRFYNLNSMQFIINEQKLEQCSNTQHHKKIEPQFDNRICTKFVKIKSENLRTKRQYMDKT
jgi:hypothetical protein